MSAREDAKSLLDRRARALAVPPPAAAPAASLEALVFSLAGERYAIELRFVREVTRLVELAPVPGLPPFYSGVTNVRGEIVALVDLRGFLGVAAKGLTDASRAIVLGRRRGEFAILADELSGIVSLAESALLEPPPSLQGVGRERIRGVTADAVLVLDGRALLEDPRLILTHAG